MRFTTLKNTTKATDAQVKSVEDYIDKTARATGVADDQLRPSLDRLVRSTQDLQNGLLYKWFCQEIVMQGIMHFHMKNVPNSIMSP